MQIANIVRLMGAILFMLGTLGLSTWARSACRRARRDAHRLCRRDVGEGAPRVLVQRHGLTAFGVAMAKLPGPPPLTAAHKGRRRGIASPFFFLLPNAREATMRNGPTTAMCCCPRVTRAPVAIPVRRAGGGRRRFARIPASTRCSTRTHALRVRFVLESQLRRGYCGRRRGRPET
jgi:hypothetical protein